MPAARKAAPGKPRRVARDAGSVEAPAASGGAAGGATTGATADLDGVKSATSAESPWSTLGWFAVGAEGVTVHFGIDQQQYVLDTSAANYNALFSMLLACWLEHRRLQFTYSTIVLGPRAAEDAPRRILSVVSI